MRLTRKRAPEPRRLRVARPRTLLSLTLIGLGLVTLPLLIGVATAAWKLNDLMQQSRTAVTASADSMRENERVTQALTDMSRNARYYFALGRDADSAERFRGEMEESLVRFRRATDDLTASVGSLTTLDQPPAIAEQLGRIQGMLAAIGTALTNPDVTEAMILEDIDAMDDVALAVAESMRNQVADRLAIIEQETRSAQRALAWQAGALVPGTFILVFFFILLVGRPMRQIDRAIRELGKGDLSRSIAISGPADIETLGRQLEWLRLRLQESTEEKNRFLRHMSHELKTPLANIREGTELLLDGSVGDLDKQQSEVTGILRDNGVRLQRLIENLLTFSAWQAKTASLDITTFELKPFVFSALSQHRLTIAKNEIDLELDIAPIRIRADEGKLRLVLENLLSNAIKFTPGHGKIAIRARADAGELVLEVADSGPGILPEEKDRIFEAFFQGRRQQAGPVGGTGIGLSVVFECVQAHAGSVSLREDSMLGGAHFEVRLPLEAAESKPRLAVANG